MNVCVRASVSILNCECVCHCVSPYATATAAGCCFCSRKELLCRNMEGRRDEEMGIGREVVVGKEEEIKAFGLKLVGRCKGAG